MDGRCEEPETNEETIADEIGDARRLLANSFPHLCIPRPGAGDLFEAGEPTRANGEGGRAKRIRSFLFLRVIASCPSCFIPRLLACRPRSVLLSRCLVVFVPFFAPTGSPVSRPGPSPFLRVRLLASSSQPTR